MIKPTIFISHITSEKEIAKLFQEKIQEDFLEMFNVFVSSDHNSINPGSNWLNRLSDALQSAQVQLIICSRESVQKPWINFEAGAAWVKEIPVIPICHTNLRPSKLPLPLNLLQGIVSTNIDDLQKMYGVLAQQLNCQIPNSSFEAFAKNIEEFEKHYGVIYFFKQQVHTLIELCPQLRKLFLPNATQSTLNIEVNDILLDKMKPSLKKLHDEGYITYNIGGLTSINPTKGQGVCSPLSITIQQEYRCISHHVFDRED